MIDLMKSHVSSGPLSWLQMASISTLLLCASVGIAQQPDARVTGDVRMCETGTPLPPSTYCVEIAVANRGSGELQFGALQSSYLINGKVYAGGIILPKEDIRIKPGASSRVFEFHAPFEVLTTASNGVATYDVPANALSGDTWLHYQGSQR
jgi:hypothetical protein